MSGNFWPAVTALATVAGVVVAVLALDSAPSQPDPDNFSPQPDIGTAAPQVSHATPSKPIQKTPLHSPPKSASTDVDECVAEADLESGHSGIRRVQVGACWRPCDGVKVVVEEIYLDTDGTASNRVMFDWNGREVEKQSYEVGTSLQLAKSCQIYIDSTGDTLYSQYVNLVVSSDSD